MANETVCPLPFLNAANFSGNGFVDGRLCEAFEGSLCCLPCPVTDWAYPDTFKSLSLAADWVSVASAICCIFLLLSWAFLPVEKTNRHYLSICLTVGIMFMNLGFVIPLAAKPAQCYDAITPNSMNTSGVCAASGTFIILGGWAAVTWVFLRSLSLHLQICWQLVVGRPFMWISQGVGWGLPVLGIILALTLSGVSFRFGTTCHINHQNSLAVLWIPLLVFAGLTIVIQFTTFGYCIKVYLSSLADNSASTENSNLPSYTNSVQTMSPRQAYRRVRRVIQLQWRGICIVLIIIADVIFFSLVFVFQDNTVQSVQNDPTKANDWVGCLVIHHGDQTQCFGYASNLVVNIATVGAVLILLAMNGIWALFLMGRWAMIIGWIELFQSILQGRKKEFVSVDARLDDLKKDTRSYEMLSREDSGTKMMDDIVTKSVVSPQPLKSPASGRRTPDFFSGQAMRYHTPVRSFSSPRPPQPSTWDERDTFARPQNESQEGINPLGLNRF